MIRVLAVTVLVCTVVLGCGVKPTETILGPESNSASQTAEARSSHWSGYYPLTIGNVWTYEYVGSKTFAPARGDTVSKRGRIRKEVRAAGISIINGNAYVRREIMAYEATQTLHLVDFVRQDQFGLFEPEDWFPGIGKGSYEAQQLEYPLHVGQTWMVDPQFRNVAVVLVREIVQTPCGRMPAWKIRMNSGSRQPEENYLWYGDLGYLGFTRHAQYIRGGSNPITVTEDESEWLVAVDMVGQPASE